MLKLNKIGLSMALLLAALGVAAQGTINKSFSGIDEVEMSLGSGDAIFEKSSDGKVYVELTHDIDDYDPTIEQRGSKLMINEEKMNNRRSWSGSSLWTIKVPDNVEIDYNTGSGDVTVNGLAVEMDANSGSGNFTIRRASGEIKINTGSGNLRAEGGKGSLSMNAGSGDIDLKDMEAEVSANVGSGDISVTNIALTGKSSFNSGSGDVEVSLAKPLSYDISVNSGSGDATLDFGSNKIEGLITMEANKDDGDIKAPFAFDSTEEIGSGRNTTVRKTKKMGSADVEIKVSTGSGTAEIQGR
jgi:hypothetical protein